MREHCADHCAIFRKRYKTKKQTVKNRTNNLYENSRSRQNLLKFERVVVSIKNEIDRYCVKILISIESTFEKNSSSFLSRNYLRRLPWLPRDTETLHERSMSQNRLRNYGRLLPKSPKRHKRLISIFCRNMTTEKNATTDSPSWNCKTREKR